MSASQPWLWIPEQGSIDSSEVALMVPYSFDRMLDHVERLPDIDSADPEATRLARARTVTAAQWERDVVAHGAVFPESVDWPPGRVVDLPVDVCPGEWTQATRHLSAFWIRWTFGSPSAAGAPFNATRAMTLLLALARTPDEIATALRLHCEFDTQFLRVALTRPDADPAADEKWAAAALAERWPGGLPEPALLELMNSSDRALREYAIRELPRVHDARSSGRGRFR